MAKKLTAFQKLDRALTGNWGVESQPQHVNTYDMSKGSDILYRTTNKDDYDKTKLELQQNKYLKDQWYKSNVNLEVSAFANLNYIQLMYRDAELMDAFPEIGAALDTFSEEASLTSENGSVVNVYSKSERIRSILEDLFVNRLNLQITAPMVIRAMCKYGNQFMLLNIDNKLGVKGWRQLPVFDVERIENGIQNPYAGGGISVSNHASTTDSDDPDISTTFIWNSQGQSQVPFRNWQIGHFRLLNNSMYLPYGVSVLNSARRHFRMLSLMEDMMFIYRLERSMERRVYKIYVGAIDDADVPAYIENIANQFKRTPIVDPMTGQIDLRKNILPVRRDTPIPLLDGRTITIEELAKEYEEGKENFVYSVQDGTHQIVPGKVAWCGKNYTAEKLVKITLDDDSYMVMAPEHEIIMRDGSKKRADMVSVGESVMPLYRDYHNISSEYKHDYERTYNPNSGKYEFTHRLIGKCLEKNGVDFNTIHHKDFNPLNNSPLNLQWMTFEGHRDFHNKLNSTDRIKEIRRNKILERWNNPELKKHAVRNMTVCFDDFVWSSIENEIKNGKLYSQKMIIDYINNNLIDYLLTFNESKKFNNHKKITKPLFRARLKDIGYNTCDEYLNTIEEKYGLVSHYNKLNKDKSERSKKCNFVSNFGTPWAQTDRRNEIAKMISKRNHERYLKGDYKIITEKNKIHFDEYVWDELRKSIIDREIKKATDLYNFVNEALIKHLIDINSNNKTLNRRHQISPKAILKRIRQKYGFNTTNDYIEAMKLNHKISAIEYVTGDDVYCMTVVGLNGEDDRHNFALTTWKSDGSLNNSGVFVSNCVDNDLFIPVRSENTATPIDTLQAGQNLTAMDDIKFVQNKLATALRIPKAFMNFEEAAGDGKNLALMDIRFTRIINHIQQAFLMELTKIASIHLYLLGFGDDITNFSLTMNNPSTQAEQLEIENLQKKIGACRDAISDPGNGIPIMSQMRALKEIMKWSEKDIKENLEEIRLERAIAAELEKTTQIIKRTNIFDTVDRIYGEPGAEYVEEPQQGQGPDGGMGGGPMGGGGGFGGGLDDLGAPGAPTDGDIQGQEGVEPTQDMQGDSGPQNGSNDASQQTPMESKVKRPVLTEEKQNQKLNYLFEKYMSKLGQVEEKKTPKPRPNIIDKSVLINEEFTKMMTSLDNLINEETEEKMPEED